MSEQVTETTPNANNAGVEDFLDALKVNDETLGINKPPAKSEEDKNKQEIDPFSFVPEDDEFTRKYITDKGWKSPSDVISELQSVEKTMDDRFRETMAPPDSFASTEDIENYGRNIGRPEKPEDYDIQNIENMDEESKRELLSLCHQGMMNQFQVERFIKARVERDRKVRAENRANFKKEETGEEERFSSQNDACGSYPSQSSYRNP